ncbi:MAG: HD-GYP domain-containing protein [Thermodesulfovibrionia bacterium]|nr:HD-GYP domain-containing protein [Thermodesulfovibrionia bacterium]
MIKKIKVKDLRIGMFIHDINCKWLRHPFFGNSIKVTSEKIVEKIIKYGIEDVYIDTEIGIDDVDAPTREEAEQAIYGKLHDAAKEKPVKKKLVSLDEEIITAKKIKKEAVQTVHKIKNDIKMGKQIEKSIVESLVDNILDSVFRNEDALIALGKLRKINEYVHSHSMSVCVLMSTFAKHLGFDGDLIREIGVGAMLHDVGTAKIAPEIINKTGALTESEFEMVKKHVDHGRYLLENTPGISEIALLLTYQHHERLDGSGYPIGLEGDDISQFGKAIAIVDVYDALTTKRCYKGWISPTEALKIIYEKKGVEFDRELVEKFIRCLGVYPVGSLVRLESGLLGFVVSHNEDSMLEPIVRIVYDTKKESIITFPYDVDLSKPMGKGGADRILGHESPEKFDIHTGSYI